MFRGKNQSQMALRPGSGKAMLLVPSVLMVWMMLAGFALGTVLCPFHRPSREEVSKERKTMLETGSKATAFASPIEKERVHGARTETATFSMG